MKLYIEQWIENKDFSENVNLLFLDSIICYKSGANRASLLFSYLAFLTLLKERIIGGVKPNLFNQGDWDSLILKLQNEDTWEKSVFDATQQKEKLDQKSKERSKDPIFNIDDNLRLQIKYWKDRRNDCAHCKDNNIDTYHIESFWAFIESNFNKITIEGGLRSLINKIHDHYDPTITPPGKEITPLIREIEYSVKRTELKCFWETLLKDGNNYYSLSKKNQELVSKSLELNNNSVNEDLLLLVKNNNRFLRDFLSNYPDKISRFNFLPKEVRKFWKTELEKCNNILKLYVSFLSNGLIPKDEISEANITVINSISEYDPSIHENKILIENSFIETFKKEIFYNSKFVGYQSYLWVNNKADIISGFIKNNVADKEVVIQLIEHYKQQKSSDWLLERFDDIFDNKKLLNKYKSIVQTNGITIPQRLKKYFA